ncbi:TPA: hypothetical protein NHK58_001391 [Pseudomonas aeruginosa]|nr:hypothetical protein [Pseudomonas aeruginosa]
MEKIKSLFKSYTERLKGEINKTVKLDKPYKSAAFITCLCPALLTFISLKVMDAPVKATFPLGVLVFAITLVLLYVAFKKKEIVKP